VRVFIDLTTPADRLEPYGAELDRIAERRNIAVERVNVPIPDVNVVDASEYDRLVDTIEQAVTRREKVYIHCWGGIGRTGTVAAWLLGRRGMNYDEAMLHIGNARAITRKASRRCPEADVQHELLRQVFSR
jgi:protein-tyrosine phosphatase